MTMPNNILQAVETYNEDALAFLQNYTCFLSTSNKEYENFNSNVPQNLGATVTFDLPPRFQVSRGLVVSWEGVEQRKLSLTANKPYNVAVEFTSEQFMFYDVERYMKKFGKAAIIRLGNEVERDIAAVCRDVPYRFYANLSSNLVAPINQLNQLSQAIAQFRNFGAVQDTEAECYIDDLAMSEIVGNSLTQFVPDRNEKNAMSWNLGMFNRAKWYQSNLLPEHYAGTEGNSSTLLTVVSTTLNSDGAVIAITFSGTNASNDVNSVKLNDSFYFVDGVSGQPNLRFLNFTAYNTTSLQLQFRSTADAASTGGSQVTVSVDPPLQVQRGKNQNINQPIVAGMKCRALNSCRFGVITSGKPIFLAMPKLPNLSPYETSSVIDKETGASLRTYYGAAGMGTNQIGIIHDTIIGVQGAADYMMKVAFPL